MVKVKINGETRDVPEDKTIFEYLRDQGEHVPGLCKTSELDPTGACRLCLVDTGKKIMPSCTIKPGEGMELETLSDKIIDMRRTSLELMLSDHDGDCIGPCQDGCPAGGDVQGYLALISMGKYHDAVALMKEKYILPAVLGRVCPAFCEDSCRRNLVEEPLSIRLMKRYAADRDLEDPWMPETPESSGKKVAVVGGGPSGLSCGYYLRLKGHDVTVFEAMPELGGMVRYGIPEYRMPRDVLAKDIKTVTDTGIEVKIGSRFGRDVTLDELRKDYDAVFVGIGSWKSRKMRIEGEELKGVLHGIDFLRAVNSGEKVDLGKKVFVVGGGDVAMDVVRTCIRLGSEVSLVYRRSRAEMPARDCEIEEAEEEGVNFELLTNPARVLGEGKVEQIELIRMELGEPDESGRRRPIPVEDSNFIQAADNLIIAIGQGNDDDEIKGLGLDSERGRITADEDTLQTELEDVFAGGDAFLGPNTVVEAIASGRRAAMMIDLYFKDKLAGAKEALKNPSRNIPSVVGDPDIYGMIMDLRPYNHWKDATEEDYLDVDRKERVKSRFRSPDERKTDFKEVELSLTEEEVAEEGKRCMSCGCDEVFKCKLREYSTLYEAKQDKFPGVKNEFEIDESHTNMVLDNNKCVLCGRCVNLTQEITGEGAVGFLNRGFDTMVSPPLGRTMADSKDMLLGDMIDACPTGALTEKLPFEKPGPWRSETGATICNGCGLGCEMNLETYKTLVLRASAKEDGWNAGHLCDICRFRRTWSPNDSGKGEGDGSSSVSLKEALSALKGHGDDIALVLTGDVTLEEAERFEKLAQAKDMKLCTLAEPGVSNASLKDLAKAKRIRLDADLDRYPVMKVFLNRALENGAQLVEDDSDIVVTESPAEPGETPTIVLHPGINDAGQLRMGLDGISDSDCYLVVGNLGRKLDGFTVVLGQSPHADLCVRYPGWVEKEGTVVDTFGREMRSSRVVESDADWQKVIARLEEL